MLQTIAHTHSYDKGRQFCRSSLYMYNSRQETEAFMNNMVGLVPGFPSLFYSSMNFGIPVVQELPEYLSEQNIDGILGCQL